MKVCFRLNLLLRLLGCVCFSPLSSFPSVLSTSLTLSAPLVYFILSASSRKHMRAMKKRKKIVIYKGTHHCLTINFRGISQGFSYRR